MNVKNISLFLRIRMMALIMEYVPFLTTIA
jgi:hypothetical protein